MHLFEIIVFAFLAGVIGVSVCARPNSKQASDMGLEVSPKRNTIGFNFGVCLPLLLTAYLLNMNETNLLWTGLYVLWICIGTGVMFARNGVPLDPGMPKSSFATGARTWLLGMLWPVATFVMPLA